MEVNKTDRGSVFTMEVRPSLNGRDMYRHNGSGTSHGLVLIGNFYKRLINVDRNKCDRNN